ncbi:hypothetical protein HYX08_05020 [Candidatus Woesearchaeota archaeon]|nr:hypothetical protein [Candidatus Woesearchaeota archaeon]
MREYPLHLGKMSQPKGFFVERYGVVPVGDAKILAAQYRHEDKTPYVGVAVFIGEARPFAGVEYAYVGPLNGLCRPDLEQAVRKADFQGKIFLLEPDFLESE